MLQYSHLSSSKEVTSKCVVLKLQGIKLIGGLGLGTWLYTSLLKQIFIKGNLLNSVFLILERQW